MKRKTERKKEEREKKEEKEKVIKDEKGALRQEIMERKEE